MGFVLVSAAHSQPKSSCASTCVCVTCLCVCPVATQPQGLVLHPALKCPLGRPNSIIGAGQGPVSALRASQGHPLRGPSPCGTACAQSAFFLPESDLQGFTEEVQFQANLIKSAILNTDPQANFILIPEVSALQNCTLTGIQVY